MQRDGPGDGARGAIGQLGRHLQRADVQFLVRYAERDEADPFGLRRIDVATGEHDLEGPRRADGPR